MDVEPPAARVCKRCGHPEKVIKIHEIETQWTCPNCGSGDHYVDSWERASENAE